MCRSLTVNIHHSRPPRCLQRTSLQNPPEEASQFSGMPTLLRIPIALYVHMVANVSHRDADSVGNVVGWNDGEVRLSDCVASVESEQMRRVLVEPRHPSLLLMRIHHESLRRNAGSCSATTHFSFFLFPPRSTLPLLDTLNDAEDR